MNTQQAALNPLVSGRSVSFEIVEERPDLLKPLQQTNDQTLTTSI